MTHLPEPNRGPQSQPRRADRAVGDEAWLTAFLQNAPIGVLAVVDDGQPYINTNLFVYDPAGPCLYLHTALRGRTRSAIEAGADTARVCFSVMEMGRLLPAEVSLEFSIEYASVRVFGPSRIVTDPDEAIHGLQLLMDKYAPHLTPGDDYRPPIEAERKRTTVIRIDIEEWSGKKKEVAADFPGAYWYSAPPMLESLKRRE